MTENFSSLTLPVIHFISIHQFINRITVNLTVSLYRYPGSASRYPGSDCGSSRHRPDVESKSQKSPLNPSSPGVTHWRKPPVAPRSVNRLVRETTGCPRARGRSARGSGTVWHTEEEELSERGWRENPESFIWVSEEVNETEKWARGGPPSLPLSERARARVC